MRCKVKGCPQLTLYEVTNGPTNWTIGDTSSIKECKGFPMNPIKPLNICLYHYKKERGYYDTDNFVGRSSNPTVIDARGKTRVLGPDWR